MLHDFAVAVATVVIAVSGAIANGVEVVSSALFPPHEPEGSVAVTPLPAATVLQPPGQVLAASTSTESVVATSTITNQYVTNNPVVERIVEREVFTTPLITVADLSALEARFNAKVAAFVSPALFPQQVGGGGFPSPFPAPPSYSQRIDRLDNVVLNNPTINGASIQSASLVGAISNTINSLLATIDDLTSNTIVATNASIADLTVTGTTTTTGLNVALDCSSLGNGGTLTTDSSGNVVCAADDGGSGSVGGINTQVQFNDVGSLGGDSGFTFNKTEDRVTVTNASTTNLSTSYASSTSGVFGNLSIGNLSGFLKATAGAISTALVDLASNVTGILPVSNGGTGSTTLSGLLKGNGTSQVATAVGGADYEFPLTFSSPLSRGGNTISISTSGDWTGSLGTFTAAQLIAAGFSTTSADVWKSNRNFFATTSTDFWKTQNNFFATTSADYWESATNFFSTTSADAFVAQRNFFSTTSSDFFVSQRSFFSTTSTDYWKSISDLFSTSSASYFLAQNGGSAFSTTSSDFWLTQKTTTNLSEGSNLYFTDERVDDRVGSLLQSGSGINVNYNDGANTLTISATGGGGGTDVNWTFFNGSGVRPATSTNQVLVGGTATSSLLSPLAKLGVIGGASIDNASTTNISSSYASSTSAFFGNLSLGSLSGFLKATAGIVTSALVDLASNVTGILGVANGGTGWMSIASGAIPYGNGGNALATTTAGTPGQVLALINGLPTWVSTSTLATISGTLSASQGGTGLSSITTNQLLIGGAGNTVTQVATSSLGLLTTNIAEGSNLYYLDSRVQSFVHASSTIPKTYSSNTFTGSNTFGGSLTLGSLNGPLDARNGVVGATSSIGVLYGGTGLTALASGYIPFGAGTSAVATSSSLFFDNNNLRLGIGTSTPWASLSINAGAGQNSFAIGSSTGTYFLVNSSGNIGIGTANPGTTLDIQNSLAAPASGASSWDSSGGQLNITSAAANATDGGSALIFRGLLSSGLPGGFAAIKGGIESTANNKGYLSFLTRTNSTFAEERMRITSDGNVGIGTTSIPYAKLSVAGGVQMANMMLRGPGSIDNSQLFRTIPTQYSSQQLGLGSGGWDIQVNKSADGSFGSNDWIQQQIFTWDTDNATSSLGPNGGLRLYDDSTWNIKNQFGTMVSGNQLRIKPTWTPTLSGGKVTSITYVGGAARTGYSPNQNVILSVYDNLTAIVATTTIQADGSGTLATSYNFDPGIGSGMTLTPIVFADAIPMNLAVSRSAWVDAGPVLALARQMADVYPAAESNLGAIHFVGQTGLNATIGQFVNYASVGAIVVNPATTSPAGELGFYTVDPDSSNALRFRLGKGLHAYGAPGGDLGVGTINVGNGFFVASSSVPFYTGATTTGYFGILGSTPRAVGQTIATSTLLYQNSTGIGIGTNAPSRLLSINAASNPYQSFMSGGVEKFLIGYEGGSSDRFVIYDTDYRLVVKTGGNVGIATTSPWRKLSVTGTVGFDGLTGSTGAGSLCLDSNKQVVYNSASDNCLSSTRATKHNISSLSLDDLGIAKALEPVSFVYNEGDSRTRYGFIAEDAAAVDPHLVTYDASSTVSGIDDRSIIAILVGAVKDLASKVSETAHLVIESLTAKLVHSDRVETNELCVGQTCVTEEQFSSVFSNQSAAAGTSRGATVEAPDSLPASGLDADTTSPTTSASVSSSTPGILEAANDNQPVADEENEQEVQEEPPEPALEVVAEPVPIPEAANDNSSVDNLPATGTVN